MKYSKEVKTALLAIVAIILLIFGYSFLKGKNLLDSSKTYYAIYDEVEGLSNSSPVTINGLKVGNITKIGFLDDSGLLLVTFTVDTDFPFSKESIAQVYGGGLIGGKSIAIIPKREGPLAKSGDTLDSEIEEGLFELVNERLTPLQQKVEQVIVSTDSLITSLNEVLNPDTRNNLITTFADISQAASSFKGSANTLNGIITENSGKLDRTFTNLDETTTNLRNFSDTISQVELNQMVNNLEKVIADFEEVSQKINNGNGTAGKLINDPTVFDNLDRATRQLDELIQDVKLNPKRYVHFSIFGKNPGPYSPPKDSLK